MIALLDQGLAGRFDDVRSWDRPSRRELSLRRRPWLVAAHRCERGAL